MLNVADVVRRGCTETTTTPLTNDVRADYPFMRISVPVLSEIRMNVRVRQGRVEAQAAYFGSHRSHRCFSFYPSIAYYFIMLFPSGSQ